MTPRKTPAGTALARNKKAVAKADSAEQRAKAARRAYDLRIAGNSWWQIAEAMRITEDSASAMVSDAIRMAAALVDEGEKRQLLSVELGRLDALQRAAWPMAMTGDSRSIDSVLKIMAHRAKLTGLDDAIAGRQVTLNTIVVPGNTVEYVNSLRSITGATA